MSSVSSEMRLRALRLHVLERAHVVHAVGELHEQDADVARYGDEQLAEVLRLLGLLGDEVEAADLGEAVDQLADLGAEQLVDLRPGDGRVLDDVVQQRRDDGRVVELQVGEDGGDFERVGEIRIAGGALLVAVRLHRIDVGAVEQRLIRLGIVARELARRVRTAASWPAAPSVMIENSSSFAAKYRTNFSI